MQREDEAGQPQMPPGVLECGFQFPWISLADLQSTEQPRADAEFPVIGLFSSPLRGFASQGKGQKSHFLGF